jgi:hypothetical protein
LPEALEAEVNSRQELIKRELAPLPEGAWAGVYFSQDGPTAGTQLVWAPAAGFVIRWSTCSYGWRARVNYGRAVFQGGHLKLAPELSGAGGNVYDGPAEFVPVLWGEQHYLIPTERLISFSHAAKNVENNPPEIETFLIKEGDRDRRREGLPGVPPEYRKHLHGKPIIASISQVKPQPRPEGQKLSLNVGRAEGVGAGMKFYASFPKAIYMLVEVTEVEEHTSVAYVITSGYRNYSGRAVRPRVGWRLTSRAPRGASTYYPG